MSQSLAEQWAALDIEERNKMLAELSDEQAMQILYDWNIWARPNQRLPDKLPDGRDWFVWALISGRGFGKTRTGAETIKAWVGGPKDPPILIALVAESAADARDVMVEGESGILAVSPPWNKPHYQPSKRRLRWPNGSVAIHFSGDKPDQLRGPQFHKAWVDELAKFQYAQEVWDMLELGLRLGDKPQALVSTTPRPIQVIRDLLNDPLTVLTRGSSYENISNLAPAYIGRVISKYEGTRLGRQELHAEVLNDMPGSLWTLSLIEENRIKSGHAPTQMDRTVVAIDPATSSTEESDETGIIVGAKEGKTGYVVRDESGIYTPNGWATMAIRLYKEHGASRIVAEKNQGGDMVKTVIHNIDPNVPVKLVHASKSRQARAEPISQLMEQGRIKHIGQFARLEDQMVITTPEGYLGSGSPDRMDAMVWCMTDLMLGSLTSPDPNAYEDYRR